MSLSGRRQWTCALRRLQTCVAQHNLEVIAALRSCARSLRRSLLDLASPWVKKTRNEIHWNRQNNRLVVLGGHLNQAL